MGIRKNASLTYSRHLLDKSCLFETSVPVSLWLHSSFWYSVGSLWLGLFCLPVKEFYSTRYQSGLFFLNFMWGVVFTACIVFLLFSTGKCTSGTDKFGSVVDKMYMKIGSKFFSSLRVKTQILKMLHRSRCHHLSKRKVWRVMEAPIRMVQRPLCCSCAALRWLCGRVSSQYLDLDEVNVMLKNAELSRY